MPSNWSLERVIALVASALLEAAWLALAYLAVQWLSGAPGLHLGIIAFAGAAAAGTLLSRASRNWQRSRYLALMLSAIVGAALAGTFVASIARPAGLPPQMSLVPHPGGWLLGLAVLRGAAHAEYGDEAENAENVLRVGVAGLVLFWIVASASRMTEIPEYIAPAFVATLAFAGAGLLALGMARLAELEVEAVDRAARRRWVGLLVSISVSVLLIAVPVAAVLGVPVAQSVEAVAGPLAPLLAGAVALLAIPFSWLAELVTALVRALLSPNSPFVPAQTPEPDATSAPGAADPSTMGAPDLSALGLLVLIIVVAAALIVIASYLRQPGSVRRSPPVEESRMTEPIDVALPFVRPRWRRSIRRRPRPRTAVEAYFDAVELLSGTNLARHAAETPREHAARIAPSTLGRDVRRLAADFQLEAFAGRPLTDAEERRALVRWRRISRAVTRR